MDEAAQALAALALASGALLYDQQNILARLEQKGLLIGRRRCGLGNALLSARRTSGDK